MGFRKQDPSAGLLRLPNSPEKVEKKVIVC